MFDREVVQLITPGTVLEPDHNHSLYLLAIVTGAMESYGVAWIDLSTSHFEVY